MARHTTFRIGGLADAWIRVNDRQALACVLRACREAGIRTWLLGRGSNVLVSDQGLRGVVICLGGELEQIEGPGARGEGPRSGLQSPVPNPQSLSAGAGAALDEVATFAEEQGLAGAEFLAGIPGTVGGGLHSNAGAFGRSLGDIVAGITVLDRDGKESVLTGTLIRREYRRPMFDDGLVAVEVKLEFAEGPRSTVQGRMSAAQIREQRWAKHPTEPSVGSFFRNPEKDGERIPAGKLIEQCGLKGRTIGGARVSEKHANFLVNIGRARFADVYELVQIVKATVEEQTGILLEEEVQYLPGPTVGRSQKPEVRRQNSRIGAANGGR
ncbi:UDP-N-acetylmuramate dehydrogenase [candidate division WOR-3 bacterium]|nr:UDP-N-acetylmuramate dehydrogenase [candidate division WOR-3 bacterium]